jgi:hypothetical protein
MSTARERSSEEIRAARGTRRPPRFSATLMALGVIFFLAYVFFLRTPPEVPAPKLDGVRGTYTWSLEEQDEAGQTTGTVAQHGTFGAVAGGDAGGTAEGGPSPSASPPGTLESVYDAAARRQSDRTRRQGGWHYKTTIGAWPPVWRVATHSPLDYQGLAAVVRSAIEDGDPNVGTKVVSDYGRRSWRAAMTFADQDLVELVVDQQTGIVIWYSETTPTSSALFKATPAWASPPPPEQTYTLTGDVLGNATPAEVVKDSDYTYVPTLAAAKADVGWGPLESSLAPDGFALRAVATTRADLRLAKQLSSDSIISTAWEPAEDCVASLYTRGLTSFTVVQYGPKATRFYRGTLDSILKDAATGKLSFESETLQYGWFKGLEAHTWYEKGGPTLLVSGRHRTVYVTGGLTRQELITFAEGLRPLR